MNPGSSHDSFLHRSHFGSLDGLRCISIVAVIWAHGPGQSAKWYLLRSGRLGVELFFAISGFLITTLLLRERQSTGGISLRQFYARRALRIFPLYYAILAIYLIFVVAFSRSSSVVEFVHNLPYFLTYTANWFTRVTATFGFAWSLATEEQFYCAWPWIEKYFGGASSLIMAGFILFILEVRLGWIPLSGFLLVVAFSVAFPICFGVLLAHLLHGRRGYELAYRFFGWQGAPLVAVAASLLLIALHSNKLVIAITFTSIVGSCVIREDHWLKPLLGSRAFVRIGVISYGMYLMHGLAYNLVEVVAGRIGLSRHGIVVFLAAVTATFLLASVSYRYYEAIFLRLKPKAPSRKPALACPADMRSGTVGSRSAPDGHDLHARMENSQSHHRILPRAAG